MTSSVRKPGRPRERRADRAIIEATLDLLKEEGLGSVSVEAIAARAGVSKATIYRRWDSKEEVIIDAVVSMADAVELDLTGDIRTDLIAILRRMRVFLSDAGAGSVFPWLIGEISRGSELGRRYAESVIHPRRAMVSELIQSAILRGDLRSDLDSTIAVDMLMGPVVIHKLLGPRHPPKPEWEQQVVDGLLAGWRSI